MNQNALKQAWERFHRAKNAAAAIRTASSIRQIERAWSDFLSEASAVYSKLEKGSKHNPRSEPWFGRIKHQRRSDPLLSYIYHARNSDEHMFEEISDSHITRVRLSGSGVEPVKVFGFAVTKDGDVLHHPKNEGEINVEIEAHFALLPVRDDRFPNDIWHPPKSHLGAPLEKQSADVLAELSIKYLEGVLREAASYVQP